jgi:hypothetical protein
MSLPQTRPHSPHPLQMEDYLSTSGTDDEGATGIEYNTDRAFFFPRHPNPLLSDDDAAPPDLQNNPAAYTTPKKKRTPQEVTEQRATAKKKLRASRNKTEALLKLRARKGQARANQNKIHALRKLKKTKHINYTKRNAVMRVVAQQRLKRGEESNKLAEQTKKQKRNVVTATVARELLQQERPWTIQTQDMWDEGVLQRLMLQERNAMSLRQDPHRGNLAETLRLQMRCYYSLTRNDR